MASQPSVDVSPSQFVAENPHLIEDADLTMPNRLWEENLEMQAFDQAVLEAQETRQIAAE